MSQYHLDVRIEEVTICNPHLGGSQSPDSRPWHPRGLPLGIFHTVPLLSQLAFKSAALEKAETQESSLIKDSHWAPQKCGSILIRVIGTFGWSLVLADTSTVLLSGAQRICQRSAWGTSKWLGPETLHIQCSCQPCARWSVFIGGWRKGRDYRLALCNHMWFIKRARKWYRTRNIGERMDFREADWQRINSPVRHWKNAKESWILSLPFTSYVASSQLSIRCNFFA